MAPVKNRHFVKTKPKFFSKYKKYFTFDFCEKLLFDPSYLYPVCLVIFVCEVLLNIFIIEKVNYTEIDWIAYMQEVEGFLNGTWDYQYLKGDTGPLVYPAGFVYIYSGLYYITSYGKNIHLAQYIFLMLYLAQIALFYRILIKTLKIPPYALMLSTITSYRIHSIFVLRLFNDPIAVLLFYASLNLFISNKWILGSIFYSLAVSVKMNILLYAPCLLIAYLTNLNIIRTILHLIICGLIQILVAVPFLYTNYYTYLKGSFDLGRVFEHKWTVNYRFLPREYFEDKYFHIGLLVIHVGLLILFTPKLKQYLSSYAKLNLITTHLKTQLRREQKKKQKKDSKLNKVEQKFVDSFEKQLRTNGNKRETIEDVMDDKTKLQNKMSKITQLFVLPFFITNLIGVACARSLHYQFYSWYFHSLLYLVFCSGYRKQTMFLILAILEYCWNAYPSTNFSSVLMHICHVCLIIGVYKTMNQSKSVITP
ncbi:unnamed protein product [Brassicogethes aeneus]|uniref:dolichyl-P-Man:Man5GlcNAc2-PP-dolichol alpha-1,3-mannosyltransferase n=1 Tax=Brassicogethes aeneus TaxID=1431903 RepID=A0A9P0AVG4_BRAAE|nr:unnamed protein product [Brassicogethes aeneus]